MSKYEINSPDEALECIASFQNFINCNMSCFSRKDYCACLSHLGAIEFLIVYSIKNARETEDN